MPTSTPTQKFQALLAWLLLTGAVVGFLLSGLVLTRHQAPVLLGLFWLFLGGTAAASLLN